MHPKSCFSLFHMKWVHKQFTHTAANICFSAMISSIINRHISFYSSCHRTYKDLHLKLRQYTGNYYFSFMKSLLLSISFYTLGRIYRTIRLGFMNSQKLLYTIDELLEKLTSTTKQQLPSLFRQSFIQQKKGLFQNFLSTFTISLTQTVMTELSSIDVLGLFKLNIEKLMSEESIHLKGICEHGLHEVKKL